MDMPPKVQIKGIREGLLISLSDDPWDDVQRALLDQIDQQAEFLKGARLALDVGNHALKAVDLGQLRKEISDRDLTIWAVLSHSPMTQRNAEALGLEIRIPKPYDGPDVPDTTLQDGEAAIIVRRTLRSGFSLQHAGHVVVIGDVNPGAQVIARGDVVVWGRLRGMVHAGAEGNDQAIVCALDLSPTQLRISDKIAVTPKRRGTSHPEMARLQDGQVIAEPWEPKRERR
jgi:septum site-determining protein MinC